MKIWYTDHGTMVIEVEGSRVEMPCVPPVSKAAATSEAVSPSPAPRRAEPAPTPQKPRPRPKGRFPPPKPGPGVMIVQPVGGAGPDLDWQALLDRDDVTHLRTTFAELHTVGARPLLKQLRGSVAPGKRGQQSLLHLMVTPGELAQGIDVGELRAVFDEHASHLTGIAVELDPDWDL